MTIWTDCVRDGWQFLLVAGDGPIQRYGWMRRLPIARAIGECRAIADFVSETCRELAGRSFLVTGGKRRSWLCHVD